MLPKPVDTDFRATLGGSAPSIEPSPIGAHGRPIDHETMIGVLGHAEFFEPVRNLFRPPGSRRDLTEFSTTATGSLHRQMRDSIFRRTIFAYLSRPFRVAARE